MQQFNQLTKESKAERSIEDFIEFGTNEAKFVQPFAGMIANEWLRELVEKYGVTNITPKETEFATMTFNAWTSDKKIDKPVIVAAPPAFGKSAMLSMFLRINCINFPDTFGAVVVKERIEDLIELRDEINEVCDKNRAFLIKGFDKEMDSKLEYEEQFVNQEDYNVLLMTTKQLERQAMRNELEKFTGFRTDDEKKMRRSLLLIDEKPSLVLSHTLSIENLNKFETKITNIKKYSNGKIKSYYNRIVQLIEKVRKIFTSTEIEPGELEAIDKSFKMPGRLVRDFAENYGHNEMAALRAVERVINSGGEYSEYNNIGIITTTHTVHYEYTLFHTYILDGTGASDPEYLSDNFYIVQPDNVLDYSNVRFRVCDSYNLSRTALRQSPQSIENVIAMTKRIISEHEDEKTLVVTYKENVDEVAEELNEEIEAGQAVVKHFDGGRGSNAYSDCDNAIYIGTLFKGTSYYTTASQAVVGDKINKELDRGHTVTKSGLTFNDEYTEGYKKTDIAINLVQETNRLRAGRKPDTVTIYMFNKDMEMLDIIKSHYPLAKFEEYTPIEKLTGKRKAIDYIIDYFADMKPGDPVKRSNIYKELDITQKTFGRQEKNERFKAAMDKYGIIKEGTKYEKQ